MTIKPFPSMLARLPDMAIGIIMFAAVAMGTVMVSMTQHVNIDDSGDTFRKARIALVEEVRAEFVRLAKQTTLSKSVEPVLVALEKVPRHEFVPESQRRHAYRNRPLPVGHAQTISQPLVVALMTALADVGPEDKILEIGTGSGYQAAVLSELVSEVFSIEIIEPLGRQAADTLQRLGYANIKTRIGDGYAGWHEQAPFDAIVVTAAPDNIPKPLVDQLRPGGRLVIPVGEFEQELVVVEKLADGSTRKQEVIPVRFVPLTRKH